MYYGKNLPEKEFSGGEYPVYGANGIIGYHDQYTHESQMLLVSCRGENSGVINLSPPKAFITNNSIICELLTGSIEKTYLYYLLKSQRREKLTSGSAQPQITTFDLGRFKLPSIPENNEQKAIAGILSKVDEAIEAVENSIKAAERLKKSLMQNLLTGKLKPDGTWRREDEFFVDEKFGKVPKGWHIIKGNKITTKITKGQSPKWQGFEYQSTGILFVTSENVKDGYIDISDPKYLPVEFNEKIKNSQLKNGDVLINIVGASIGRCAVYNLNGQLANTNQAVCVFRTNEDNDSNFIAYYLQLEKTQRRLLGSQVETARANLSLGDFRKFKFIIPVEKDEQFLISDQMKKVISLIHSKKEKIQILKKLKKSLMQNLLTGKVRVDVEKINKILEEVQGNRIKIMSSHWLQKWLFRQ